MKRRGSFGQPNLGGDFLSAVDKGMHWRLENWGRVVRGRAGPNEQRCATEIVCEQLKRKAEGLLQGGEEIAASRSNRVDNPDGWLVETAWRSPAFPKQEKRLLRSWYVFNLPPRAVANIARIPLSEFAPRMLGSVDLMRATLALVEKPEYDPPRQLAAPHVSSSLLRPCVIPVSAFGGDRVSPEPRRTAPPVMLYGTATA